MQNNLIHFIFQLTGQFGPIETMSCYCSTDLCNSQNFNNKIFQRWSKKAQKILKSKLTSLHLTLLNVALNAVPCIVLLVFVTIILNSCWISKRKKILENTNTDKQIENVSQLEESNESNEEIKKLL